MCLSRKRQEQKPQASYKCEHLTELNEVVIANTSNEFDLSIQFYIQLFDDSSTMQEKQLALESNWNNHKKIFLERTWNIYSKFL